MSTHISSGGDLPSLKHPPPSSPATQTETAIIPASDFASKQQAPSKLLTKQVRPQTTMAKFRVCLDVIARTPSITAAFRYMILGLIIWYNLLPPWTVGILILLFCVTQLYLWLRGVPTLYRLRTIPRPAKISHCITGQVRIMNPWTLGNFFPSLGAWIVSLLIVSSFATSIIIGASYFPPDHLATPEGHALGFLSTATLGMQDLREYSQTHMRTFSGHGAAAYMRCITEAVQIEGLTDALEEKVNNVNPKMKVWMNVTTDAEGNLVGEGWENWDIKNNLMGESSIGISSIWPVSKQATPRQAVLSDRLSNTLTSHLDSFLTDLAELTAYLDQTLKTLESTMLTIWILHQNNTSPQGIFPKQRVVAFYTLADNPRYQRDWRSYIAIMTHRPYNILRKHFFPDPTPEEEVLQHFNTLSSEGLLHRISNIHESALRYEQDTLRTFADVFFPVPNQYTGKEESIARESVYEALHVFRANNLTSNAADASNEQMPWPQILEDMIQTRVFDHIVHAHKQVQGSVERGETLRLPEGEERKMVEAVFGGLERKTLGFGK